jgi:hypothetical protein
MNFWNEDAARSSCPFGCDWQCRRCSLLTEDARSLYPAIKRRQRCTHLQIGGEVCVDCMSWTIDEEEASRPLVVWSGFRSSGKSRVLDIVNSVFGPLPWEQRSLEQRMEQRRQATRALADGLLLHWSIKERGQTPRLGFVPDMPREFLRAHTCPQCDALQQACPTHLRIIAHAQTRFDFPMFSVCDRWPVQRDTSAQRMRLRLTTGSRVT